MASTVSDLVFGATVLVATLLGLSSTVLGLLLDWPAMAAVAVGIVVVGTLGLDADRVSAGLIGGLTALLAGFVAPLAVLAVVRTGDVLPLTLLLSGGVLLAGFVALRVTVSRPRPDAGPHA